MSEYVDAQLPDWLDRIVTDRQRIAMLLIIQTALAYGHHAPQAAIDQQHCVTVMLPHHHVQIDPNGEVIFLRQSKVTA